MKTFTPITFVMVDCRVLGRTTPGELMRTNGIIAIRDKQGHDVAIFSPATPPNTPHSPPLPRGARSRAPAGQRRQDHRIRLRRQLYTHRHPRSLIGKRPNGEVVMAVIDGRAKGQAAGATIARNGLHRPPAGAHGRPQPRRRRFFGTLDSTGRGGQPPQRQPPLRPCRRTRRTERHRRPSAEIKGAVLKRCPAQPRKHHKKTAPRSGGLFAYPRRTYSPTISATRSAIMAGVTAYRQR